MERYDKLLRREPDNVDYLFGKAQVLLLSGQPEAARVLRRRARSLDPAYQDVWRPQPGVQSEQALERQLREPVRQARQKFIQSLWDLPQDQANAGLPALTDLDYVPLLPVGGSVPKLDADPEAAYVKLHAPAALARYDRLLRRDPDNVDYLFGKAQVLVMAGQPGAARPLLRRARTLIPGYEEVWRLQIRVLSELGLEKQVRELARQASQKFPRSRWDVPQQPVAADPPTPTDLQQAPIPPSSSEAKLAAAPAALARYDALLRREPDNVDHLFGKAQVLVLAGQPGVARPLLRRARTLKPEHEEVWRLQIRVLSELGLEKQARELARQASQKFPQSRWDVPQQPTAADSPVVAAPHQAPIPPSSSEAKMETAPDALARYDALLRRDPDNVDYLFGKAQVLVSSGQPGVARPLLRRARTLKPEHEEVWRLQIRVLSELGLEKQARELTRQASQKFPQSRWDVPQQPTAADSSALTDLQQTPIPPSGSEAKMAAAPAALARYDALLRREPDNVDYLFGKAQVLVSSGQPGVARPLLRRARTLKPEHEEVWRLQIRALSELGLEKQARELARQARLKFPQSRWDVPQTNRGEGIAPTRKFAAGRFACDLSRGTARTETRGAALPGFKSASPWVNQQGANASLAFAEQPGPCDEPYLLLQVAAAPVARGTGAAAPSKNAATPPSVDSRPQSHDATSRATGGGSVAERPARSSQPDGSTPMAAPVAQMAATPVSGASSAPSKNAEAPIVFDNRPPPYDPTVRVATAGAPKAAEAAPVDSASSGERGWGLAPIRWGGSASVQANRNARSGGAQSSELMETVNMRGATYIYQPWLAQVSANIGLSTTQASSSSGVQVEGQGSDSQPKSSSVTGGGSLNLFPSSRFPFLATFDVSDSRSSTELVNTGYTNTRVGLRQSYSPEEGGYGVVAGYNSSKVNFGTQGSDSVNALFGDFFRNTEIQSMQANVNYSQSSRELTGDTASLLNLNARHTYRALDNLSIDSLASLSDNNLNYTGGTSGALRNRGRYLQFNSFANWHPEEDEDGNEIPLNVNVGVRALSAQSDTGVSSTGAQSLGANLSATYRFNQNLSLSGNGIVTRVATEGGDSQVLALFGGGASYVGDPLTFGKFSYFWNTGASGNQQTGGKEGSNQTLTGQFGHSLYRPVELGEKSSLNFTLGQNVSQTTSGLFGSTTSLSHNAGAAYHAAFGESLNGTASLNLSDTLTTGANASGHFTNLNLLLSGQAQFSRYSSGSINMTFMRAVSNNTSAQNVAPVLGIDNFFDTNISNRNDSTNVFGSATYQHRRVFGISRLRYSMNFNANTLASSRDERLAGNVNAPVDNLTYSFDNRLDYRIGRLDLQLRGAVAQLAGKNNAMVFFKVSREFGGF